MLNGNTVATLPFNQVQGVHKQSQGGSMFDQNREDSGGIPRGRMHITSTASSS